MLLRLIDIPVFHNGFLIEIPNGLFEVAEACAGIRFLIANIVVAAVFAHLSYRSWWKWVLFMLLAVLVPVLANGLRAFGIILIAYLTDNEYAVGVDHLVYGWGFFTVVMLVLLFVGNLFADRMTADPQASVPATVAAGGAAWVAAAALVLIVAAPAYARLVMQPRICRRPWALPDPPASAAWQPSGTPHRLAAGNRQCRY